MRLLEKHNFGTGISLPMPSMAVKLMLDSAILYKINVGNSLCA